MGEPKNAGAAHSLESCPVRRIPSILILAALLTGAPAAFAQSGDAGPVVDVVEIVGVIDHDDVHGLATEAAEEPVVHTDGGDSRLVQSTSRFSPRMARPVHSRRRSVVGAMTWAARASRRRRPSAECSR